jgi:molecular chaperone HtpG
MATKAKGKKTTGGAETMGFQAEVGRLLDIVANALYSEREIFLRELISNAADACDRLRYLAIETPALTESDPAFKITLSVDKDAKTLTVADNGTGMTREELIENLGTIARSGSAAFVEKLSGDAKKDVSLIGQFGVGFYSGYMVADSVSVVSRRAGEGEAWKWTSDGRTGFTIEPAEKEGRGTAITLSLKDDAGEYLEEATLRRIVKTYSDHIPFPIELLDPTKDEDADTRLNEASALWTRNKSEIDEQQYKEFYHHVAHAFDDPWLTLHFRAEGVIEYTGLVYIPTERPLDLFHPERLSKLKLYVKRVFITEDCDDLLPSWLRFLRGVIDSEDLPLNVSREMLQNNPVVGKIKTGLVKRVLAELGKKAETDAEGYANFWDKFGLVLKEGLYEGGADKETLLKLCRFRSTKRDGLISLDDYVADMKEGQDAIYYISGEDAGALKKSPQLEGFDAKGVEVLLMTDPVDEFWLSTIFDHDGKPFKSVTRAGADLSKIKKDGETEDEKKDDEAEAVVDGLVIALKLALGDTVKDVRASDRLTSSAVCLVADENAMDMHLERLLKQHNKLEHSSPRILEINPDHALIQALTAKAGPDGKGDLGSAPKLLLDQARILEGETLPDPADFARNMADVMAKAFG